MDIKAIIKKHGLKQADVARQLGKSESNFSQIISNENIPIATMRAVASVIGCHLTEFFEDELPKKDEHTGNNELALCETTECTCPHCGKQVKVNIHFVEGK